MALENLLSPTHSLWDSLGPDPQCPPLPWTVRAPCFPRPHSLTQHPPTTQPLPVTSRGEENTALSHVVGKSRKDDMPWRESSVGLGSFSPHPSSQSTLWPWPQAVPKTLHTIQSQAFLLATPPTLTTSLSSRAQGLSCSNLSSGKL